MTIGDGKIVCLELEDKRLVFLDLDTDEDWGDINIYKHYKTGKIECELGNDVDGHKKILRVWESKDNEGDFLDEKFNTYSEVDITDFIKWSLSREIAYCDGMSIAEHRKMMEEYGFDYDTLDIPDDWKECAPDYGA